MLRRTVPPLWIVVVGLVMGEVACAASLPGDAEAASHGDEAARVELVPETEIREPGFIFRQYNLAVLSHYSYLVGAGGEAMIVDPARDVARYLQDAKDLGLRITRVYLTHSHADFVAGHLELAAATGATVLQNRASGVAFDHTPVDDGATLEFGAVRAVVMTTPGHTPDGTCLLIHQPAGTPEPRIILTGDTLFIGSVGRPDLMGGAASAAQLAAYTFESWHGKLSKLPDAVRIFPAHGAGSLCGAHLSDEPVSTLGEQRTANPYLRYEDLSRFVMAVIDGIPEAPQYFKHNAAMNREGPPLVDWEASMPAALSAQETRDRAERGAWVVDIRDPHAFAESHVPKAIHIGLRGRFETWVGTMVPWGEPLILIGRDDAEVEEAASRLHRIGYDDPQGYLAGGMEAWREAGFPPQSVAQVPPGRLHEQIQSGTAPILVDVRLPAEWMAVRISDTLLNIPVNKLAAESSRLDPSMPVLTVCNSAYRSIMAASILQKEGFKDVLNMDGGGEAWIEAGLPTFGSERAGIAQPGVYVNIPERMGPQDLAQRLMDLPGTIDVIDIRPAWQYAEFAVAGSVNVPVQEVMANPAYLTDRRPLVLVCRDGAVSAAVAGALVQKSQRPIRFLDGGARRYFDEIMRPGGIRSEPVALPEATGAAAAPTPPAPPAGTAPVDMPRPRKRSAGC